MHKLWFRGLFEAAGDAGSGGGAGGATLLGGGDAGAGDSGAGGDGSSGSWSWAGEDGKFSDGWLDRLGDLSGNESLRPIGSIPDLARSYVETKKLIGSKLEMPGEGAKEEDVARWRKTVGAPETPEGYLGDAKTLRPESIPEDMWDSDSEKAFLALAHKHHLPPAAVKEILGYYGENFAKGMQSHAEQEKQVLAGEMATLKKAWGGEFEPNLNLAARVAKTVGLDPQTHPIFTSAEVVQAFAKLGRMFDETSLVQGDAPSGSGGIDSRIKEIQDPQSTAVIAREYRGEHGPERQQQAAEALRQLLQAKSKMK